MTCGIIDIGCAFHKILDPLWFWIFWGFWTVVVLVALGILYRVKQVFGWQGVVAAVTAAVAALIAIFSFKAGRDSVMPNSDGTVTPKKPRPKRPVVPADENELPGHFNRKTGTWNP